MSNLRDILCQRRRLAWLSLALLAFLGLGLLLATNAHNREVRARRLADEIKLHGGDCSLAAPVTSWIDYWRGKTVRPMPADVLLRGSYCTREWLAEHDYLSDLKIDRLAVYESPLTGEDVRAISQRNPLRSLNAVGIHGADQAARGRWQGGDVESIDLRYTDLTDEGLRQLPLPQIRALKVAQTPVTARGLQCLSGCSSLVELGLDGDQFDGSLAGILNSLPGLSGLYLEGSSVTDRHIRLVQSMPQVDGIIIEGTSATPGVISEYIAARPDSIVTVDGLFVSSEE